MLVATSLTCHSFGTMDELVNLLAKMTDSFADREIRI